MFPHRNRMTLIELLVILAICGVLGTMLGGGCLVWFGGAMPNYSNGSRSGELFKVSEKGIFWRSWECDLKLSDFNLKRGGNNINTNVGNVWSFSTTDAALGKKLLEAEGHRVKISYHQYLIRPIQQSTDVTATDVEILKD